MQVKKNRFDGEVGEVSMLFNTENKRYFEISPEERMQLLLAGGNLKPVFEARQQKYGTLEPNLEIDVKTNKSPNLKQIIKKPNKTQEYTSFQLNYYSKLRDHLKTPLECRISDKNKHYHHITTESEYSSTEGDDDDPSQGGLGSGPTAAPVDG